jgi:uncharacterized protein YfkK (UPF0435 family)
MMCRSYCVFAMELTTLPSSPFPSRRQRPGRTLFGSPPKSIKSALRAAHTTGAVNVNFTLRAGDVNNDNAVDITDLLALIAAYNKLSPNAGYLEGADFNADGTNDITDLLLLIGNYNQIGDP